MNESGQGKSRPREITIERIIDAPRTVVFSAWTDPELLARWFAPRDFTVENVVVNPTVGGTWELVMVDERSGQRFPNKSKILELTPPERIVLSDSWEPLGVDAEDTILTVTFTDVGGKTLLNVYASPMPDNEFSDGAFQGWSETLDKLARVVS